jgi:hypothetical protein
MDDELLKVYREISELKERYFKTEDQSGRTHERLKEYIIAFDTHKAIEADKIIDVSWRLKNLEDMKMPDRIKTIENMIVEFRSYRVVIYLLLALAAASNDRLWSLIKMWGG